MTRSAASAPAPSTSSADFDRVAHALEQRAREAEFPDEKGRLLNLAGDIAFDAGHRELALGFYGASIDVYMKAAMYDPALLICRKIVQLTPEVVRARCTLAWLAVARGLFQEARERVADYGHAAARAGHGRLARGHLRMMAEVAQSEEVLEAVAEALLELGDVEGADAVYGLVYGHGGKDRLLPEDPEERWRVVVARITGVE